MRYVWAAIAGAVIYASAQGQEIVRFSPSSDARAGAQEVIIPDPTLNYYLRSGTGICEGPLTEMDLDVFRGVQWPDGMQPNCLELETFVPIYDLTGLGHCRNLVFIDIRCYGMPAPGTSGYPRLDLAPITTCQALETLTTNGYVIWDLEPLANTENLREVTLRFLESDVDDLWPLAGLQQLETIEIAPGHVSDLTPLSNLPVLNSLDLSGHAIEDLSPLASVSTLTKLMIGGNPITDLTPLAQLTGLRVLGVPSVEGVLARVAELNLPALSTLYAGGRGIVDLTPLASIRTLRNLHLSNNAIVDVSPLAALDSLADIDLDGNAIWDIGPLLEVESLDELTLCENPLGRKALCWDIPALEARGVWVWKDGSCEDVRHSADQDGDEIIALEELLRVIQLYNSGSLHCAETPTEDGYAAGPGLCGCEPHASDYAPADWRIDFSELLRCIQFYNSENCHVSLDEPTEDGFVPARWPYPWE